MKRCKGINKASGIGCLKELPIHKYGLCKTCFGNWLFSPQGLETLEKTKIKASKKVVVYAKKEAAKGKKGRRFELLTYAQRIQEARKVFQKWIRERDKTEPCISCQTPFANEWHAGHYRKCEVYSQLIFNEDNTNRQCNRCNVFLGGNEANYRQGLVKKIGELAVLELESVPPNKVYRYSNEELKKIIETYK